MIISQHSGHRKRLKEKFAQATPESFADYELLEIFLFLIQPRKDVKPEAKNLIQKHLSLAKLFSLPLEEVELNAEIGINGAVYFKLFKEIARRMAKSELIVCPIIDSTEKLFDYLRISIGHLTTEHFIILYLDKKNMLLAEDKITSGTVDQTIIYPREIIKKALSINATALIMVHNHPSNNCRPSTADINITQELKQIANSLNIILHDHIIITSSQHFSFKQQGLL